MTEENKFKLELMKISESLLAQSYWENLKFYRDITQGMGAEDTKVKRIGIECEVIRKEWVDYEAKVKEFIKVNS